MMERFAAAPRTVWAIVPRICSRDLSKMLSVASRAKSVEMKLLDPGSDVDDEKFANGPEGAVRQELIESPQSLAFSRRR